MEDYSKSLASILGYVLLGIVILCVIVAEILTCANCRKVLKDHSDSSEVAEAFPEVTAQNN